MKFIVKVTQGPDVAPGMVTSYIQQAIGNARILRIHWCALSAYKPDGRIIEILCNFNECTFSERAQIAQGIRKNLPQAAIIFLNGEIF